MAGVGLILEDTGSSSFVQDQWCGSDKSAVAGHSSYHIRGDGRHAGSAAQIAARRPRRDLYTRALSPESTMHTLIREQMIERPLEEVFAFHADARNLERITPPWLSFRILTQGPVEMRRGAQIDYRIRVHGVPVVWKSEIREWGPPHRFVDVQLRGPYRMWEHAHEFAPVPGGTLVRDVVNYALPAGWMGELVCRLVVDRDVSAIFDYRQKALAAVFGGRP
jgi:ligand-binding SRPBCC domain-containing protein